MPAHCLFYSWQLRKQISYQRIFGPSYFVIALAHKLKFHSCFLLGWNSCKRSKFPSQTVARNYARPQVKSSWINFFSFASPRSHVLINALSFYRSQNVMCRSECFEPAQKFDCFLCHYKNQFYWMQITFGLAQNVCDCHNKWTNIWSDTKNLNQHKTFWDL